MAAATESLARTLACALDPVVLAEAAALVPDDWQAGLLRSSPPRLWLNASRQSGKSTMVAVQAVHTAVYRPRSLVLLLSPGLRQSQELFKKSLTVYRALGRPVSAQVESALRLELDNGSRIISLPGQEQTIRGYSGVALLAIDEASRVPDDLFMAVLPMLAVSRGRLVAISTPWGTRGWWHEASRSGDWERRTADGREVKIGKAWLVGQLQVLLQSGRLHLPKTAEAEALAQELLDYEIRIDPDGNDKYGAFKVGRHDDLVTALGLAVQPAGPSRTLVSF